MSPPTDCSDFAVFSQAFWLDGRSCQCWAEFPWSLPLHTFLVPRCLVMKLETTRFGTVEIQSDDILFFRYGLFGFESQQQWVLLSDLNNPTVAWLQSMVDADIALPVVSPRRFVSGYQVQLDDRQIALLSLAKEEQAAVLAVVSRNGQTLTCNLRAPIVINLDRRVGCQVVTADEQPLQYPVAELPSSVRKSA